MKLVFNRRLPVNRKEKKADAYVRYVTDYVGSQTAAASVPIRDTCNSLRLRTSPRTERLQIAQFSPSLGELLSERDSDTMAFSAIYGTLVIHSVCGQLPEPSVFKQRSFLLHLASSYQRGTATRWRFQPFVASRKCNFSVAMFAQNQSNANRFGDSGRKNCDGIGPVSEANADWRLI